MKGRCKVPKDVKWSILNIIEGFSKLKNKNFPPVIILTILIWTIYILEVFLVQNAFNLNLSIHETIFILFMMFLLCSFDFINRLFGISSSEKSIIAS